MPGGLHPPAELVLAWQTDSFPHGIRRGPMVVIVVAILYFVTLSVVLGRIYARLYAQPSAGLDDFFIFLAMVPTTGLAISICLADRLYGFDRHVWDLTIDLAVQSREITFAISNFYIFSTSLTKLSILCFYRRMATNTIERWFLHTVWASMAFVIGYTLTFILTTFLGCTPLVAYWNQVDPLWSRTHDWHCFNEGAAMLSASAISVMQDVLACGLPLLLFRKLQIPRRQKIALGCIFSVGIFICITGILRIVYIRPLYTSTYDIAWEAGPVWAWTAVEAHMAIICASAPALKLFFRKVLAVSGFSSHSAGVKSHQKVHLHVGRKNGGSGGVGNNNTSFPCVGEGGVVSLSEQRAYEMESYRDAMESREALRREDDNAWLVEEGERVQRGGLRRMGSLRGAYSASVGRGNLFGDPNEILRACAKGDSAGSADLEMGIKVEKRVDVTVTEARYDEDFLGLEDEAKDAGSSAETSSETNLVRALWKSWL
ncbi:hypothetical protein B0J12DRAFT_762765 [Macrophomina phaseolina]|uniref:Rhodopsin domain-containing protein n=1 Tax=Macrophomina phaseolina TaxID=35725 RepID=A0ABQ8G0M9_9PEZI|nr:hypothetical protein B0J12DRAFT_762765 [Macrophomina phaseolina]